MPVRYREVSHASWHDPAHMPYAATMEGADVLKEFEARADSAKAHKDAFDADMAAMYEMLPDLRRALQADTSRPASKRGPKGIEEMAHGLIPRDTASRRTAAAVGTSRKKADA